MPVSNPSCFNNNADNRAAQAFIVLATIFTTTLVSASMITSKYGCIRGLPLSGRDMVYPSTFFIMHVVAALYSIRRAQVLIKSGLIVSILVTVLAWVANSLPIAPHSPVDTASFSKVFGSSPDLLLGSLVAYLAGQWFNVYFFVWLRRVFDQRHLWLSSSLTTLCAQLLDATVLWVVAHRLLGPMLNNPQAPPQLPYGLATAFGQYVFRVLMTLMGTLLVCVSVSKTRQWIRG